MSAVAKLRAEQWLDRMAGQARATMRSALARAFEQIRERADLNLVGLLLEQGDITAAASLMVLAGTPTAQAILRQAFSSIVLTSAGATLKGDAGVLTGRAVLALPIGSERAAQAMKTLELDFFPDVFRATEIALRAIYAEGLREGVNPRTLAREARALVGLTEYDYNIIGSFENALRAGDFAAALDRDLRDARFDATLRRAIMEGTGLTEKQIQDMAERYGERLLAWRSETWARTAALDAVREGNLAGWGEALDVADVAPSEVVKTWQTTLDGREREDHHNADGLTVPFDEPFPVDGGVQVPGEGVWNCRCTFSVRILPAGAKQAKAFLSSPDRQARGTR